MTMDSPFFTAKLGACRREREGRLLNLEASVPSPLRREKVDPITGETLTIIQSSGGVMSHCEGERARARHDRPHLRESVIGGDSEAEPHPPGYSAPIQWRRGQSRHEPSDSLASEKRAGARPGSSPNSQFYHEGSLTDKSDYDEGPPRWVMTRGDWFHLCRDISRWTIISQLYPAGIGRRGHR
jgi:hypothetical protein